MHDFDEKYGPELIKFPETKEEVSTEISAFLQRFGFPQVIGCIDGTHIPIKQPVENAHDYFSYKQTYSINCQAIYNAIGQFTNVEVKWPGSLHDARVFSNCDVQKRFSDGKLDLFYKELLPGEECVSQLLLGDPAYPLLSYVMKELHHCSTDEEVIFNQMLRAARNQIQCAFGRPKARWSILLRPMDIPVQKRPNLGGPFKAPANAKRPSLIDFPTLSIDCEIFSMALFDSRAAVANWSTMLCFNFNSCFAILR